MRNLEAFRRWQKLSKTVKYGYDNNGNDSCHLQQLSCVKHYEE